MPHYNNNGPQNRVDIDDQGHYSSLNTAQKHKGSFRDNSDV